MKKIKYLIVFIILFSILPIKAKAETPTLEYSSHVQDIGWMNYVGNDQISGTTGKSKRMESLKLKLNNFNGDINYRAHVQNVGWMNYVKNDAIAGTTGRSLRIEAIQIVLTGEDSLKYDIYYRTHVQNIGWMNWVKNDQISGTTGRSLRIEALQIKIVPKEGVIIDDQTPQETTPSDDDKQSEPIKPEENVYSLNNYVTCSSYVQSTGWKNDVYEGQICGTTGQSKSLQSISLKLNTPTQSGIQYETYTFNQGWQQAASNGQESDINGIKRSIEAIKINLNGTLKDYYDIYYRTHVSNIGWLDWAKNGAEAGSIGSNTQVEAIEVRLVRKDATFSEGTQKPFVTGKWDGNSYYDCFNNKVTGFRFIDGIKYYFNNEGTMIGKNVKKVIDVSSWQYQIDWDKIKNNGDVDAAIIRVGWGMSYYDEAGLDSYFDYNIKAVQRLNIPYSIYIYGYAKIEYAGQKEAQFVIDKMNQYNIPKDTFVWYDAEINSIPLETYNAVIPAFVNHMKNNGYNNVGVYGSLNNFVSASGNLNSETIRSYPLWVAQYYKKIQYPDAYLGWQYSSSEYIDGINGRVDVSMFY